MSDKVVLISGATGKQGGAVARSLAGKGFKLRGLTRKPGGDAAKELAALGVEIVQGDLDDAASLKSALAGAWGAFGVQNTWEAGVEREEEQGKRFAALAKEVGVSHFVYTSVGSADEKTGIPHFDNKSRVEDTVRSLSFASHVILRPVFFMENVVSPWFLQGDKVMAGLKPTTKVQMVAVEDIGRIGAAAFLRASELNRREIELAGDSVDMPTATKSIAAALGKNLEFVSLPIEAVRQHSQDMALMLEWFERTGYSADISALDKEFGPMLRFEAWVRKYVKP
ncbi:MAG TPA: NmrA/HSCARG family protein [Polyangiaceae bacterium]|nr:NmrA/HSCARG family protein [Polyangiaceae bacterium]